MDNVSNVLACDVGNTFVRFASVNSDEVSDVRSMRIGELGELGRAVGETWAGMPRPKKIVAASVNPPALKALEAATAESPNEPVLVVGRDLPLPIDTDLPNPEAVGTDRLCCASAAFDRLGVACVVADFGTAITIDCVNAEGVFVGGSILPGLAMQAESLQAGTAQLPRVRLVEPDWVFGKDTRQAIIGGIIFGARGLLRERVEAYATQLGQWPTVIATGGDAKLICGDPNGSQLVQAIVPNLSLHGVAMAYYRTLLR